MICVWSLLDVEAYERGHTEIQGWLPLVPGLRLLNKRPSVLQGLSLPTGFHRTQLLKEPRTVFELGEAGYQGITKFG